MLSPTYGRVGNPRWHPTKRLAEFRTAAERGDLDYLPIWAGEAVDLIAELESASALVARIAEDAARTITETANAVHDA